MYFFFKLIVFIGWFHNILDITCLMYQCVCIHKYIDDLSTSACLFCATRWHCLPVCPCVIKIGNQTALILQMDNKKIPESLAFSVDIKNKNNPHLNVMIHNVHVFVDIEKRLKYTLKTVLYISDEVALVIIKVQFCPIQLMEAIFCNQFYISCSVCLYLCFIKTTYLNLFNLISRKESVSLCQREILWSRILVIYKQVA